MPPNPLAVVDADTGELRAAGCAACADLAVKLAGSTGDFDSLVIEYTKLLRQRDALAHAQRHLLWMARLAEHRTAHWLTPSRLAEAELSAGTIAAFARTHEDVSAAWQAGRALWHRLDPDPPEALIAELDRALGRGSPPPPAGPAKRR